jgi:uroporphyrinogen-III synthase
MKALQGKKILITRDRDADDEFSKMLTEAGAETVFFPVIKISEVEDHTELDNVLSDINKYDGIFFTSSNAVKYFFESAKSLNAKYTGKIYSVGEKTKQKVELYGYKNKFVPAVYSAEELIKLLPADEIKGKSFLFPRGNLSMDKLKNGISGYAQVHEVKVYENSLPADINSEDRKSMMAMFEKGDIDCISFFSPSSIKNFLIIFPGFRQKDMKIAVIGKTTFNTASEFGLKADIIPDESTSVSMARAIIEFFNIEL